MKGSRVVLGEVDVDSISALGAEATGGRDGIDGGCGGGAGGLALKSTDEP